MEQKWSIRLIQVAALFGFAGTYLGTHMSGAGSYAFRPIHAHILLVGWLSVFAWGIFYKVYKVKWKKLVTAQAWCAILGSFGLTSGMWIYNMNPFGFGDTFKTIYFIVGGSILLLAFLLFIVVTFAIEKNEVVK